jgi:hypothetical protein
MLYTVLWRFSPSQHQLDKIAPSVPDGTSELSKLAGYNFHLSTDMCQMHGAYELEPGPSREALAIAMPAIGPVEPCRLTFGEMNAGQIASVPLRAAVNALPEVVKGEGAKAAVHVGDVARGDVTWQDNCLAWQDNNFGLSPSKTYLGFPSVDFWGFNASKKGTTLADKNLNPIERMAEPANLPELRHTLGVFVQSKGYVDEHAMIVEPLHALTRHGANKLPVPCVWGPVQ